MLDPATRKRLGKLMANEEWSAAIVFLDSIADGPKDNDWLWKYGWAQHKVGATEKALRYLLMAYERAPHVHATCWTIGIVYSEIGNRDLAELFQLRALALRDTDFHRTTLAMFYAVEGSFELAEAVHKEGLRLRPSSRARLLAYADFLSDVGRGEEAVDLYRRASQIADRA